MPGRICVPSLTFGGVSLLAGDNRIGGLGIGVVAIKIVVDCHLELGDVSGAPTADVEEAIDEIESGGEARLGVICLAYWSIRYRTRINPFVRSRGGHSRMARSLLTSRAAKVRVKAVVVVCLRRGAALFQRQVWLGAVERVDLAVLLHAWYQDAVRRMLYFEPRSEVALEAGFDADAPGARRADAQRRRRCPTPVRRNRRRLARRLGQYGKLGCVRQQAFTRRRTFVVHETFSTCVHRGLPALNAWIRLVRVPHDFVRAVTVRPQHDLRPRWHLRRSVGVNQSGEPRAFCRRAYVKADVVQSHGHWLDLWPYAGHLLDVEHQGGELGKGLSFL